MVEVKALSTGNSGRCTVPGNIKIRQVFELRVEDKLETGKGAKVKDQQ